MNFTAIFEAICRQIKREKNKEKQNYLFESLQTQLNTNIILKYQFDTLQLLKKAKNKLKTPQGVDKFISEIISKQSSFKKENDVSPHNVWKENKKLLELYNINPDSLELSSIDKALKITALDEKALKKYINCEKNVHNFFDKKRIIKEIFTNIILSNDEESLAKNVRITQFLGEQVESKRDKFFIIHSLKKIKTMNAENKLKTSSSLKEATQKLYKLRLLTEKQIARQEFPHSNFGKRKYSREGKIKKLQDLAHFKRIEIEAPSNYNCPEKIVISFEIPFYPTEMYRLHLSKKLKEIKVKMDRLERIFINKEIYQKRNDKMFNPIGTIWYGNILFKDLIPNKSYEYHLSIYLNTTQNSEYNFDDYCQTAYEMLADFDNYVYNIFGSEVEKNYQKDFFADKGRLGRKNKYDARRENEYDLSLSDNYGGMF